MRLALVALDMGGVVLQNESGRPLIGSRLDFRGRQAMVRHLGAARRLDLESLDSLLFAPWAREYGERHERGAEASWTPHLERLRRQHGVAGSAEEILGVWFRPYGEQLSAVGGALDALTAVRARGLRLALISNVPLPGALYRELLDRAGLLSLFDDVQFSYDTGSRKPSPAMLRRALERFDTPLDRALMIGDRRTLDIASGRAAGVPTAWIEGPDRAGPEPDWAIPSIRELPGLIERIDGG